MHIRRILLLSFAVAPWLLFAIVVASWAMSEGRAPEMPDQSVGLPPSTVGPQATRPLPTAPVIATYSAATGLRLARAPLVEAYESKGYTCSPGPDVSTTPQVLCTRETPLARLQVVGQAERVETATLAVTVAGDTSKADVRQSADLLDLLALSTPDWPERETWLAAQIQQVKGSRDPVVARWIDVDGRHVGVTFYQNDATVGATITLTVTTRPIQ